MNLKLEEKEASALFLALDICLNFDLNKENGFTDEEIDSVIKVYKKVKNIIHIIYQITQNM